MRTKVRDREKMGPTELLELCEELDAERAAFQMAMQVHRRNAKKRQSVIDELWNNVPEVKTYLMAKKQTNRTT